MKEDVTVKKKYAAFVGNGLNRAVGNDAWIDMLEKLRKDYGIEKVSNCSNLPLEFERMYLDGKKYGKVESDSLLKKGVAAGIPPVEDLSLHKRFIELDVDDFITSNYDYYLESAVDGSFAKEMTTSHTRETKHSLFRYIEVEKKRIWHMHGEVCRPNTICLGYDHYCTYLARIVGYLSQPQPQISKKTAIRHIVDGEVIENKSWLELFFTHDIFILGLTMSFLEIDIWWLLCYRMRIILENPHYNITNTIHYYYAASKGMVDDEQISLLESTGVKLHPEPLIRNNWKKLYSTALTDIEDIIKSEKAIGLGDAFFLGEKDAIMRLKTPKM